MNSPSATTDDQDLIQLLFTMYKERGTLYMNTYIRDNPSFGIKISNLTSFELNDYVKMVMAHRGEDLEQLKRSKTAEFTKSSTPCFTPIEDCKPSLATFLGLGCEITNRGICKKLQNDLRSHKPSIALEAPSGSSISVGPTNVFITTQTSDVMKMTKLDSLQNSSKVPYRPRQRKSHTRDITSSARLFDDEPIPVEPGALSEGYNVLSEEISDLANEIKSLFSNAPDPQAFQSCEKLLDKTAATGLKFWTDLALTKSKCEDKLDIASIMPLSVAEEVQHYTTMLNCYKKYVNEEESKRDSLIAKQKEQYQAYELGSNNLHGTVALKISEAEHEITACKAKIQQLYLEEKSVLELKLRELAVKFKNDINEKDHQFQQFKVNVQDEANDILKFYSEEMAKINSDLERSQQRKKEDLTKPKALIKVVEIFHELLLVRVRSASRDNAEHLGMNEEADFIKSQLYTIIQPAYHGNDINKMIDHILYWNPIDTRKIHNVKL